METNAPTTSKLLLTAREAAEALSVCEKTIWSITEPRGDLPCVRIGRRVLYSVEDLQRWIDQHRSVVPSEKGIPAADSEVPSL